MNGERAGLASWTSAALDAAGADVSAICRVVAATLGHTSPVVAQLWVTEIGGDALRWLASSTVSSDGGPTPASLSIEAFPETAATGAGPSPGATIVVPLSLDGQRTGLLIVERVVGDEPFAASDVAVADAVGAAIALRVDHARLSVGARRYALQQQSLARIGEFALRCPDADELMDRVVQEVAAGLEADVTTIFSLNRDGSTATALAAVGDGPRRGELVALSPSAATRRPRRRHQTEDRLLGSGGLRGLDRRQARHGRVDLRATATAWRRSHVLGGR